MASVTHQVLNQPPPLVDYNVFTTDRVLMDAVRRYGADWALPRLEEFGCRTGSEEVMRWGFQANEFPPVLETHDRFGNRRDEVEFHPAWHSLMALAIGNGLHNLPWSNPRAGAHVARAALMLIAGQNEAGHICPVSMSCSAVPVLRLNQDLAHDWEPAVLSSTYDPRFRPRSEKAGVLMGMGLTEKQGGSDVRANTTRAERVTDSEYAITGHKWFCSAPMCDAFLVLAQAPEGLTCFFLPRWTSDGVPNGFHIQRLKRKLGNRSNASCEVEFHNAYAQRVGEVGRGVRTIIEMVQHTRLDCCIGSAALMRRALVEAVHHTRHRSAFGRLLWDQPLMREVLAGLAVDSETATLMALRVAHAFDARVTDSREHAFARLATAVAKYWICKRTVAHVGEALECLGGSGYVEESILPRLYREAPLNSIWEGCGNIMCLDVLRVLRKEPECADAFLDEVRRAKGCSRIFDEQLRELETTLSTPVEEATARRITTLLGRLLAATLLALNAPVAVAQRTDSRAILDRAF